MPKGAPANPTSAKAIEVAKKRAQAIEMRIAGHTLQQIADKLGYADLSGASHCLKSAIKNITLEPSEEMVKWEDARLDRMLASILPAATVSLEKAQQCLDDDSFLMVSDIQLKSIDRVIRIMDRRAKLHGLDKPTQVHNTGSCVVNMTAPPNPDQGDGDGSDNN